jgi:transcriptional regulator with XRE-family HTH domain
MSYEKNRKEKIADGLECKKLRLKLGYSQQRMSEIMTEYSDTTGYMCKLTAAQICCIENAKTNYTVNSLYDYRTVLYKEIFKTKII